ncbi:universal stress protein [Caenimonas aquaedulcis]|uniref:Universal stress protein n=1 Tax=Caenimonas aquaedulcis TaxID=2793270 RepID=A0A931MIZ2_9BURK|nr:universal stress protein [Caenimonas aquaedulcis]MBG9390228.1 universal stress protein [Caenimonas aquaedulcis]
MHFDRILVAFDGSPAAELGLREAVRLAQQHRGRLRLIHVMDELAWTNGFETAAAWLDDVQPRMRRAGEALLARGCAAAAAHGVAADSKLVAPTLDRVCEEVAREALAWPADLIVAGCESRTGMDRLLLGNEAEQIARHAPVPVLLVKDTSRHAPLAAFEISHSAKGTAS